MQLPTPPPPAATSSRSGRTRLTGLAGSQRLTLALGFGNEHGRGRRHRRRGAAGGATARLRAAYRAGWHSYLAGLAATPRSARSWQTTYNVSEMVLAASEDKTFRGGFVAAPGRPWAWANELQHLPVYHAVWSRDLYQIATALIAMGDRPAARRALNYLWTVQQRPDGSFPQNSRLDGEPVFGGLQMDEVAFPIVLTHQLGARSGDWAHIRRSADFLVARGPRTDQERWENIGGFSPATIAAEIAGLVCAADVARSNGDGARARTVPGDGRPVAAQPRALHGDHERAAVGQALLPADHRQRRREHRGGDPDLRRWPARRPAAGRRPELPRGGAPGREVARPTRTCCPRCPSSTGSWGTPRPTGRSGTAPASTGTASGPTAPSGSRCRPARARRSAGAGRC